MTTGSGTQNVQTQTKSSPWAPAQPELQSILKNVQGLNPSVNPTEQAAITALTNNSQGIPNLGPTAANTATNYFSGDPFHIINPAYSAIGQSLSPLTNPNNLNPWNTPGFSDAIKTANQDITNQINGEFAAAGRSGSGMNTQTLARGLSQGDAGLIADQYNKNVGNLMSAAGEYFGAGTGTNTALGQNVSAGATIGAAIPQFATQGPAALLSAGQAPFNLQAGNLGELSGITVPIAGLGGQTSGTQTGQTSYSPSPLQAITSLGGLFGTQGVSPFSGMMAAGQGILGGLGKIFGGS